MSEPVAMLSLMRSEEYSALVSMFPESAAAGQLVHGRKIVQGIGLPSPFPESLGLAWTAIVIDADGGVFIAGDDGASQEREALVLTLARTLRRADDP